MSLRDDKSYSSIGPLDWGHSITQRHSKVILAEEYQKGGLLDVTFGELGFIVVVSI